MTIKLTASIAIAGAHQTIGTLLTLNAALEAGLVNRGVAIYSVVNPSLSPSDWLPNGASQALETINNSDNSRYPIDFLSSDTTTTHQYNASTGALMPITPNLGQAFSVVAGGGPYGGDCLRIVPDNGVNGKARATIGGASPANISANPKQSATITISNSAPAVVGWVAHNLRKNQPIQFSTTGALPTGLVAATTYYVSEVGLAADAFQVSATPGGASISTTAAGSGVHTGIPGGLIANTGYFGFWVKITLGGTVDALDTSGGQAVLVDYFAWETPYGGTYYEIAVPISYLGAVNQSKGASGEWVFMMFRPSDFSAGGIRSVALDAISVGAVCSANVAARTTTVDFGPVYANIRQRPSFTISLDNDDTTHYTAAFPYMQSRKVIGQLYTIAKYWGSAGVCTELQIREMHEAGWGIGLHANGGPAEYSVTGFAARTAASLIADVSSDIAILKKFGDGWKHGAWPLGMYDSNAINTLKSLGVLSMRETGSPDAGIPLLPQNCFWIDGNGAWANNPTTQTWAQLRASIDDTILLGGHLDIWGHVISAGTNFNLFKQCVDYLVAKRDQGLCDILTASQRYERYVRPRNLVSSL